MRFERNFQAMARWPSIRAPRLKDLHEPFTPPPAPRLCSEETALLAAVIAEKNADAPREDYANWLLDHGDAARGRFILDQLAGKMVEPDPAWGKVFDPWSARDLEYVRGFVEAMSLSGRAFISLGEPLFTMTPLRRVRLVAVNAIRNELDRCPHVGKLESLFLGQRPFSRRSEVLTD